MTTLTLESRALGWHLGLGDIGINREVCHGYANCCDCSDCEERAKGPRRQAARARQPWEPKAA